MEMETEDKGYRIRKEASVSSVGPSVVVISLFNEPDAHRGGISSSKPRQ